MGQVKDWADMTPEERKQDFLSSLSPNYRHREETLMLADAIDWSTADCECTPLLK